MARLILNALILAAFSAGVLALRIIFHGETFNARTLSIVTLGASAGGLAGAVLTPFFRGRRSWLWRIGAAASFVGVFMLAMMTMYVLESGYIARLFEALSVIGPYGFVKQLGQRAGFFLAFSPTYLLPWQLPLLALLAGALLPGKTAPEG